MPAMHDRAVPWRSAQPNGTIFLAPILLAPIVVATICKVRGDYALLLRQMQEICALIGLKDGKRLLGSGFGGRKRGRRPERAGGEGETRRRGAGGTPTHVVARS